MKIVMAVLAAVIAVPVVVGGAGYAVVGALFSNSGNQPSQEALADIPSDYLALYQAATQACPGLDWSVLAAIGKIETNHGRSTLPGVADGTENFAGARVISGLVSL